MNTSSQRTRLHDILEGHDSWSDELWRQAERYLTENTSTPIAFELLILAGLDGVPSIYKVHQLRELRKLPPATVLRAWEQWKEQRRAG